MESYAELLLAKKAKSWHERGVEVGDKDSQRNISGRLEWGKYNSSTGVDRDGERNWHTYPFTPATLATCEILPALVDKVEGIVGRMFSDGCVGVDGGTGGDRCPGLGYSFIVSSVMLREMEELF